jgi:hypothetical protein
MNGALYTIEEMSSAQVVERLLGLLFPDAATVLDTTYGSGSFWRGSHADVSVTGLDLDPARARDVVGDFTALPFLDNSFDVVIFDPPYHTDVGRKGSVTQARFGSFKRLADLQLAVQLGTAEAWRVSRLGVIVKVQDYIHASRAVWMSLWVHGAIPVEPFDVLHARQISGKIRSPKWKDQLSVYRNHATYWVYRKDGPLHRRRRGATPMTRRARAVPGRVLPSGPARVSRGAAL